MTNVIPETRTRRTWIAGAVAVAVLLLAGIGWYVRQSSAPGIEGPDEGVLASGLGTELPPYIKLNALQIQSSGSTGDSVEPVFTTRFRATLVLTTDTFAEPSVEPDAVIVMPRFKEGTVREMSGVALSTRPSGGTWKTQFSFDDNPIPALGQPRESFQGQRVIVRGSAEEIAFREEQRRRHDEEEQRAQAQREAQLAEQRRLDEARRQAESTTREAEVEAERRRAAAVHEAELRRAGIEAQQRDERAAQDAAEAARRQEANEAAQFVEIRAGTELNVRLSNGLNSGTARVEDRFEAVTLEDLTIGGRTAVPAGSVMRGIVAAVQPATRTNRTARMTLTFDRLTINGQSYPIRGRVTQAIAGQGLKGEAGRIATGGAVGAIIGGILGGAKGALAGIGIGAGGTIAATEGKEVELSQGTVLRVRIDSPVQVR